MILNLFYVNAIAERVRSLLNQYICQDLKWTIHCHVLIESSFHGHYISLWNLLFLIFNQSVAQKLGCENVKTSFTWSVWIQNVLISGDAVIRCVRRSTCQLHLFYCQRYSCWCYVLWRIQGGAIRPCIHISFWMHSLLHRRLYNRSPVSTKP